MISGEVPRGERREDPDDDEQDATTGSRRVRHASRSSLRRRTAKPFMPTPSGGGAAGEAEEDVLERRPRTGDGDDAIPAAPTAAGARAPARSGRRRRRSAARASSRRRGHPGRRAGARRAASTASPWPGSGSIRYTAGRSGRGVGERALDDEPAVVEDRDPVADPLDVGQDVGREQDGRRAAEPGDERRGRPAALRVERADRLVEDEHGGRWTRARRSRAAGASRPSTSPTRRSAADGEVDPRERLGDGPIERRPVEAVRAGRAIARLPPGHPSVGPRVLLEIAECRRRRRRRRPTSMPATAPRRTGAGEAGEQPQGRRLAGAVGAEEPEHRAAGRRGQPVEGEHPAR